MCHLLSLDWCDYYEGNWAFPEDCSFRELSEGQCSWPEHLQNTQGHRHTHTPRMQGTTLCAAVALPWHMCMHQKSSPYGFSSVLPRSFSSETLEAEADLAGNSQQEQLGERKADKKKMDDEEVTSLWSPPPCLLHIVWGLGSTPPLLFCLKLCHSIQEPLATCGYWALKGLNWDGL